MTTTPEDSGIPSDTYIAEQLRLKGLPTEFTAILARAADGDLDAEHEVFSCSYARLRAIAGNIARSLPAGNDLQATALVSEAFLRIQQSDTQAQNRRHFLSLVATSMRSVLVDYCRARDRQKRNPGDGKDIFSFDEQLNAQADRAFDTLELNDALQQLEKLDSGLVEVVHLRFFLSMPVAEVAETLGVSVSTVERRFREAREWLREQMI